jgi:hypothetical protein
MLAGRGVEVKRGLKGKAGEILKGSGKRGLPNGPAMALNTVNQIHVFHPTFGSATAIATSLVSIAISETRMAGAT